MKRPAQILVGSVILLVDLAIPLGIIFVIREQPSMTVMIAVGVGALIALWFMFPVGMGQFGDWLAPRVPFLPDPEASDD